MDKMIYKLFNLAKLANMKNVTTTTCEVKTKIVVIRAVLQ